MKEIGLTLGVVESRVSQIHCEAAAFDVTKDRRVRQVTDVIVVTSIS